MEFIVGKQNTLELVIGISEGRVLQNWYTIRCWKGCACAYVSVSGCLCL